MIKLQKTAIPILLEDSVSIACFVEASCHSKVLRAASIQQGTEALSPTTLEESDPAKRHVSELEGRSSPG